MSGRLSDEAIAAVLRRHLTYDPISISLAEPEARHVTQTWRTTADADRIIAEMTGAVRELLADEREAVAARIEEQAALFFEAGKRMGIPFGAGQRAKHAGYLEAADFARADTRPSESTEDARRALWVVTELSLNMAAPPPEGQPHPERTPVGPFGSREEADDWAHAQTVPFGGGAWSVASLRTPDAYTHPADPAQGDREALAEVIARAQRYNAQAWDRHEDGSWVSKSMLAESVRDDHRASADAVLADGWTRTAPQPHADTDGGDES